MKKGISGFMSMAPAVLALILGLSNLVLAIEGDLNGDDSVDWLDVGILREWWLADDCSAHGWCDDADINYDDNVDADDFALLAKNWFETPIDPTLVAWYKLDEDSGTIACDSSIYDHNGTLLNGVTWASGSGKFDGAASFSVTASTEQIEIPTSGMTVSAGTIALWGRLWSTGQSNYRFFFGTKNNDGNRIQLYMDGLNTNLDLGLGNNHQKRTDIIELETETWHHIALTWDGWDGISSDANNYYSVYVDANEVATGRYFELNTLPDTANIGNNGDAILGDRHQAFHGLIDDVGIWNRVLEADDIMNIYSYGISGKVVPTASKPSPKNGATNVAPNVAISWSPGYYADSHDVYFGTNESDVNDANNSWPVATGPEDPNVYKGNQEPNSYDPCGLELNTIYYWRIDDVNDVNAIWKGDVWHFTTVGGMPGKAGNPDPPDTEPNVSVHADLNWTAGAYTTSHDVYFGTDFNDVNEADNGGSWPEYKGNQTETMFDPGKMDANTAHYWRIDEVGPAGTTTGDVWSFTTGSADVPVADFFAIPTIGWDIYYRPEFVSISTGDINDYFWEFGDDQNSTEMAPNHKYASAGTYTVKLTVSGPSGSDTRTKTNYITVNDFNDYPYPDYILDEPTQAAFDVALDAIEVNDGGRMLFDFNDVTIYVNWDHLLSEKRDFHGNNLIIDGQDKNVKFYYDGIHPCDQTENGPALRIHGDDNIIRNIAWDRFPDGISLRGGHRNLAENITTDIVCEDAITFNGSGYHCVDCIIRDCSFQDSNDKTIMVNDGGSTARMVIKGCYSFNGDQPIRMTGGGVLVVRHCEFAGSASNGPRFGGDVGKPGNLVIFEHNYSHGTKSGVRLSDKVSAIVRNNTIENCTQYGIRTQATVDCWARIENNTITNNPQGVFLMDSNVYMDLGGGSLDIHRHGLLSGPGTGVAPSVGGNTLQGNTPYDLTNNSGRTVKAKYNFWDHSTVQDVLDYDVSGSADVDPLGQ